MSKYSMLFRKDNNNFQLDFNDSTSVSDYLYHNSLELSWAVVVEVETGMVVSHYTTSSYELKHYSGEVLF